MTTSSRFRKPSLGTLLGGLALLVAVGTGTASAAGAFVTIQDPTTSDKAKVSSTGRLLVGDGAGPLDVVGGAAQPGSLIRGFVEFFSSGCATVYTPPAGKAAVITGLSATTYVGAAPGTSYRLYVSPAGSPCSPAGFVSIVATEQPVSQDLGPGLVIPAGYALTADEFLYTGTTPARGVMTILGYTIPASAAPAAAPAAPAAPGPAGSATGR